MRIFRDLTQLPSFKNSVVTIGTYDGVHMGHQKIIQRINGLAKEVEGESILVTFHPHPRSVVNDQKVLLLSPLEEKFNLLQRNKVDNVVVVPFTRNFSQQSPDEYVRNFLYENFQPHTIVIGYNHKFGKDRAGDIHFLKDLSKELSFQVEEISKQTIEENSVSSTKIRKALFASDVEAANQLLGHTYFIQGIVVRGQQLGRQIGFPTANIKVESEDKLIPQNGVYAVMVSIAKQRCKGMLNIGVRPTVSGLNQTIEVHIFDFEQNVYGEQIRVELVAHIREEQKFAGLKELVAQLELDKGVALGILGDV